MGCSVVTLASVVSALGGLVFGYELAIISGALLQLKVDFGLSCIQQEALVSSLLMGALLASVTGGCLIDQGRRKSILLSNILILSGSVISLLSFYSALLVGRTMVGFGVCLSSMSCCIFVSEMVAPESRGFLVTVYESGIAVGILGAYAVNYLLSDWSRGWKWMFGLAAVPTLIQLVSVCAIPPTAGESFHHRQADKSLLCCGAPNHRVSLSIGDFFKQKNNMRSRTVLGLSLVLFQQFTGQPNVLSYASTVFHSVGFRSDASALLASLGLGCVKVCATLTSTVFSDRLGRRPLLISGCSVMAVGLVSIGLLGGEATPDARSLCDSEPLLMNGTETLLHTAVERPAVETLAGTGNSGLKPLESPLDGQDSFIKWIIFLCMIAVVSAYSAGFGPMTWLLLSEIFPAEIRGRAFAFITCFNWSANLLVTLSFLSCIKAMGVSGMFMLYGALASVAGTFFFFVLPETKGKSLEEIDAELCSHRFYHREECCSFISRRNNSPQYQRVECGAAGVDGEADCDLRPVSQSFSKLGV